MTRRDYILIAAAIRKAIFDGKEKGYIPDSETLEVVYSIGAALRENNMRFDAQRFYIACGIQ